MTRMDRWDSIDFPGVEDEEKPQFRLLGLSNGELKRRRWVKEGAFGWSHITEENHET